MRSGVEVDNTDVESCMEEDNDLVQYISRNTENTYIHRTGMEEKVDNNSSLPDYTKASWVLLLA